MGNLRAVVQQSFSRPLVLAIIGILLGGFLHPYPVHATTYYLRACKKLITEKSVYGSDLKVSECGESFSTKDAYVGLVIHLQDIFGRTQVDAEILDPEQKVVWTENLTIDPPEETRYSDYWITPVLPLGDPAEIVRGNPGLLLSIISTKEKPFRERLGEWTFRVGLNGGAPLTIKFKLLAAP